MIHNYQYRIFLQAIAVVCLLAVMPMWAVEPATAQGKDKDKDQSKTVSGYVLDRAETPIKGAVVYLKNTRTLSVKSFIAGDDGGFRFHGLSPNVDYQVYAESNGQKSNTKTVSSFDSRRQVSVQLKIENR